MKQIILFLLIISKVFFFDHTVYVSYSSFHINDTEKKIIGKVRIFADDLCTGIRSESGVIVNEQEISIIEERPNIKKYLSNHLYLKIENEVLFFDILHIQKENDSVWIDVEAKLIKDQNFSIFIDLLTEIYPSQSNIVKVTIHDQNEYYKMDYQIKSINISVP